MIKPSETQKQTGTIEKVDVAINDRSILSCWVHIDFGGSHQGFGGLVLNDELVSSFVAALAHTFGVTTKESLVGMKCFALRCWGFHNDTIEGLQSEATGKIMTITNWLRANGLPCRSPMEKRVESIRSDIQWARRRIEEETNELVKINDGYIDWSMIDEESQ